jgi:hypothetical protein
MFNMTIYVAITYVIPLTGLVRRDVKIDVDLNNLKSILKLEAIGFEAITISASFRAALRQARGLVLINQ